MITQVPSPRAGNHGSKPPALIGSLVNPSRVSPLLGLSPRYAPAEYPPFGEFSQGSYSARQTAFFQPLKGRTLIEIKQGAELDRAVAEAIGWIPPQIPEAEHPKLLPPCPDLPDYFHPSPEVEEWRSNYHWRFQGRGPCLRHPERYSTDLNAALAAAEKVFRGGFAIHTPGEEIGGWKKFRCIYGVGWRKPMRGCKEQFEIDADTPALAICAAILKLKGIQ